MYSNHLGEAASVLERAFQQAPATLMQASAQGAFGWAGHAFTLLSLSRPIMLPFCRSQSPSQSSQSLHRRMQEPAVTNLASIYELMGAAATKARFSDWVAAAAPDDFDLAATKTGAGA